MCGPSHLRRHENVLPGWMFLLLLPKTEYQSINGQFCDNSTFYWPILRSRPQFCYMSKHRALHFRFLSHTGLDTGKYPFAFTHPEGHTLSRFSWVVWSKAEEFVYMFLSGISFCPSKFGREFCNSYHSICCGNVTVMCAEKFRIHESSLCKAFPERSQQAKHQAAGVLLNNRQNAAVMTSGQNINSLLIDWLIDCARPGLILSLACSAHRSMQVCSVIATDTTWQLGMIMMECWKPAVTPALQWAFCSRHSIESWLSVNQIT